MEPSRHRAIAAGERMQHLHDLTASDHRSLSSDAVAALAQQISARIRRQAQYIERQAHEIKFKDAKLEKVMFELTRDRGDRRGACVISVGDLHAARIAAG